MTVESPSSAKYTIAICKGTALLEEMKILLRAWHPDESVGQFSKRVQQEDILGRTTAYRTRDLVHRVFARRFLPGQPPAAYYLQRLASVASVSHRLLADLSLIYACRSDALLRDVIVRLYWPAFEEGRIVLSQQDLLDFFHAAHEDGRVAKPWSSQVRIKVARGVLRALADFGLLHEIRRGRFETAAFHPSDEAIVYIANELHFSGVSDGSLVGHQDWLLYGLQPRDVVSAMDRLAGHGWWVIQAAASVVRITWKHHSMEEVVDALAR